MSYVSGTLVRSLAQFSNLSGPNNPTSVTLKMNKFGVVSTPTPVSDGAGAYHYDVDTTGLTVGTPPSEITLEWIGTGTVQAIGSDNMQVTAPVM